MKIKKQPVNDNKGMSSNSESRGLRNFMALMVRSPFTVKIWLGVRIELVRRNSLFCLKFLFCEIGRGSGDD